MALDQIFEILNGTVSIIPVESMILCMAPGASALLNSLDKLAAHFGNPYATPDVISVVFDLMAKGSSLAMGMYLAEEMWGPVGRLLNKKKLQRLRPSLLTRASSKQMTGGSSPSLTRMSPS